MLRWIHHNAETMPSRCRESLPAQRVCRLRLVVATDEHGSDAVELRTRTPTTRLADEHGRAFRSIYARRPAHHGADVPDMFRGDIAQAWAEFTRTGDPGWPRDDLKRWL